MTAIVYFKRIYIQIGTAFILAQWSSMVPHTIGVLCYGRYLDRIAGRMIAASGGTFQIVNDISHVAGPGVICIYFRVTHSLLTCPVQIPAEPFIFED